MEKKHDALRHPGVYGYPAEPAARVAVETVRSGGAATGIREVIFCCFSAAGLAIYQRLLDDGSARWPFPCRFRP